jgi:catechol 2,3-dioxygenase-like lactoylglutathione lyase family enzyme
MTNLEGISLHVADVDRSLAFYLTLPDVELVFRRANEFARLRIGEGFIHLVRLPKTGFHIEINVEDVDDYYAKVLAAGQSAPKPKNHPWGKTDFQLTDPDGNRIEFGKMIAE